MSPPPVMLYLKPHHTHRAMGEAVDADFVELNRGNPLQRIRAARRLDVGDRPIITEGGKPLFQAVWMKLFGNCGPIVHLAADETIPNIFHKYDHYRQIDRVAHLWAHRYVDAVVGISSDICTRAEVLGVDDVRRCYPFTDKYDGLSALDPDLDGHRFVSVGSNRPKNNFESLPAIVAATDHEITIDVVGVKTDEIDGEGVTGHGFVDDAALLDLLARSSGLVMPAVSQMFCVAVLEAMHAGVPPIITQQVGAREIVGDVDHRLVREANVEAVAAGIDAYLDRDPDDRAELGADCRRTAELYTPDRGIERFKYIYSELVD